MEQITKECIIPEGYEIDNIDKLTGTITFNKKVSKYPMSINELSIKNTYYFTSSWDIYASTSKSNRGSSTKSNLSTRERAEAIRALCQLVELRDAWNKVDEFVADWEDGNQNKFCIVMFKNEIRMSSYLTLQHILFFKTQEIRNLFLKTFKDLIETAKEFL